MTTHLTLDGGWAECPAPDVCALKFHFPIMDLDTAEQMPLQVLMPLLEVLDPPTDLEDAAGLKMWTVALPEAPEGIAIHRDYDLPAVIRFDGTKWWYHEGFLHREGGKPAVIHADGSAEYWLNGVRVNSDGSPISW
jgi:hypothetical protein